MTLFCMLKDSRDSSSALCNLNKNNNYKKKLRIFNDEIHYSLMIRVKILGIRKVSVNCTEDVHSKNLWKRC